MKPIFSHRPAAPTTLLHDLLPGVQATRFRKRVFPRPRRQVVRGEGHRRK